MTETTATRRAAELKACACSLLSVETGEANPETGNGYIETGCAAQVKGTFAQGHDAKMKSLLIQAGAAGFECGIQDGGLLVSDSAINIAKRFGFASQVAKGIENARSRADAKAAREAGRAARKAAKAAPAPVPQVVRVGRWTYPVITATPAEDGRVAVTYLAKDGSHKAATVAADRIATA